MRFFEDPDELDHHVLPIILEYIEAGLWDLVLYETDNHINIIKKEALRLDKNHPAHGYWMLKKCKSASDVSRARGFTQVDKAEAFRQCLGALFRIRDAIMRDQPFEDEDYIKDAFCTDVELYRRNLKDIMLLNATIQVWEKKENLRRGRSEKKSLDSLRILIFGLLERHGPIPPKDLIKKLKTYQGDNSFKWNGFVLRYDPRNQEFKELEEKNFRERTAKIKQVYAYRKHALDYIKKHMPKK